MDLPHCDMLLTSTIMWLPSHPPSERHCEEEATYTNWQELRVQEHVAESSTVGTPKSLTVLLQDDLADSCQVGGKPSGMLYVTWEGDVGGWDEKERWCVWGVCVCVCVWGGGGGGARKRNRMAGQCMRSIRFRALLAKLDVCFAR
jgi:hypothetical protein